MIEIVSTEELKAMMDRGDRFTLVETLSEMSYHGGHLPGAINLPPDQVIKRAYQAIPDRSTNLVLYCGSVT